MQATLRFFFVTALACASPLATAAVGTFDGDLATGFQDSYGGHLKRGRATVAADFDLDGRIDFFLGNPGDESLILHNTVQPDGTARFEVAQVLLDGPLAWGACASDYDNDGDYDLFITDGGNEGAGWDYLFRNLWMENGRTRLVFEDVTDFAGVRGPLGSNGLPLKVASANAVWGDYDRDGDNDLFVSVNITPQSAPELTGRNILWENQGDGTFSDVTDKVGLGSSRMQTRHSTFVDIDNDGDIDLYENNYLGHNVLWQNRLVEDGEARFVDISTAYSNFPAEDIRYPISSFASAAADMNNDGWEDLIVFMRVTYAEETGSPYPDGHAVFLNQRGTGFVNVAQEVGLNDQFDFEPIDGVMGCQVGDVNGDGYPDVFLGNGRPMSGAAADIGGQYNQLYLTSTPVGGMGMPRLNDKSALLDFPHQKGTVSPIPCTRTVPTERPSWTSTTMGLSKSPSRTAARQRCRTASGSPIVCSSSLVANTRGSRYARSAMELPWRRMRSGPAFESPRTGIAPPLSSCTVPCTPEARFRRRTASRSTLAWRTLPQSTKSG